MTERGRFWIMTSSAGFCIKKSNFAKIPIFRRFLKKGRVPAGTERGRFSGYEFFDRFCIKKSNFAKILEFGPIFCRGFWKKDAFRETAGLENIQSITCIVCHYISLLLLYAKLLVSCLSILDKAACSFLLVVAPPLHGKAHRSWPPTAAIQELTSKADTHIKAILLGCLLQYTLIF